jgi:cation diffusion facilitator CzcD-associated flavoprotein CzcO
MNAPEKICVLGAGSSGLAALKNLLAANIPCEALEREDDVGGNWYFGKPASSVYASTHLISSKRLTEYVDFPMPEEWPEYVGHRQAHEYLKSYARNFGLYDHIRFGAAVERIDPIEPEQRGRAAKGWTVRLADGQQRRYRGVIVANGHNWDPRLPDYVADMPGKFAGRWLHSSQYKTADVLRGQRVLVVGGGNSGCDLACEAATHAELALLSTRRAYHVLPKFFRGKPIDQCHEFLLWLRMPLWARRAASTVASHITLGPSLRTGVPRPDHRLFETHPIINSQLHHHVGHGRLGLRPDVAEFSGHTVRFVDGRCDEIDLVIFATGFRVTLPFLDRELLEWNNGAPRLDLNIFPPNRSDLQFIGLIQPDSGQWGLVDWQSRLVANYWRLLGEAPQRAEQFRQSLRRGASLSGGVRYLETPRHALEVEHYSYRRMLERLVRESARPMA